MSDTAEKVDENIDRGQWFVVHTLSGHENKVQENILRGLQQNDELPIYEVFIPTETVSVARQGKKSIQRKRKFFPGYLLVRMDLYDADGKINEKAWYFIRTVQGVLGFLGSGNNPVPLSETEVGDLLRQSRGEAAAKPKVPFEVGETVRIKDGVFTDSVGVINEIDNERGKLKLAVSIFGRSTPMELEFWQVDRNI